MNQFKLSLIILFSLIITSCSVYQKHFGGTGPDYTSAQAGKGLKSNKKEANLDKIKSNKDKRFNIPEIPGKRTGPVEDIAPPDYANPEAN